MFEQRRSAIALIPVPSRAIYVAICLTCFIYGRSAIIFTIFCVNKSILRVRDHSMTRRFQNSVTSFFHATRCFPLFILPICRAKPKTKLRKFKLRRNRFFGVKKYALGYGQVGSPDPHWFKFLLILVKFFVLNYPC